MMDTKLAIGQEAACEGLGRDRWSRARSGWFCPRGTSSPFSAWHPQWKLPPLCCCSLCLSPGMPCSMPLLRMKRGLGRGEQGRSWNILVPCVGTASQISTFWKTIAQMRPEAAAHTLLTFPRCSLWTTPNREHWGAPHPLPSRLMLKTLHFTAHGSPSSLYLHSVTFPEPGVCWLHVWLFFFFLWYF